MVKYKQMKKVDIIVATHKKYDMLSDSIYLPLQVGAAYGKELGYKKDNTGDNISYKNPYFCELTGLYWAWKNLDSDYVGLVHYRRYLSIMKATKSVKETLSRVLSKKQLEKLIDSPDKSQNYDLILPKKRNYIIETLYSHYEHTLHIDPLNLTRDIIAEKSPEYLAEFDRIQERRSAHMFNMMIGKKEIIDKYCEWLFDILFELEEEIKRSNNPKLYDKFHSRFYGRISELLFDVWLYTNYPEAKNDLENKYIRIKELRVVDVEGSKWFKKGINLLFAKFFGKKYGKSF